jgi:translation elongation factor P/translation initiation factor 5A
MDTIWILSSKEFIAESNQIKTGKNAGKYSLKLNGVNTKAKKEHTLPQFKKYVVSDFNRILKENPD